MPEAGDAGIKPPEFKTGALKTLRSLASFVLSGVRKISRLEKAGALIDPNDLLENIKRVKIIAHKAGGGEAPEGTLLAMEYSLAKGADILDVDLRMTMKGKGEAQALIISHSPTAEGIDSESKIKRKIEELTLTEVKKIDAGVNFSRDGKTFPLWGKNLQIPTLEEALIKFSNVKFAIHLLGHNPGIEQELVRVIEKYNAFDSVVIDGFSDDQLALVKKLSGDRMRCGAGAKATVVFANDVLSGNIPESVPFDEYTPGGEENPNAKSKMEKTMTKFMDFMRRNKFADQKIIEACRKLGKPIKVWNVNSRSEMLHWIVLGADAIYTDYPSLLADLKKELMEKLAKAETKTVKSDFYENLTQPNRDFAETFTDNLYSYFISIAAAENLHWTESLTADQIVNEVKSMEDIASQGANGELQIFHRLWEVRESYTGDNPPEIPDKLHGVLDQAAELLSKSEPRIDTVKMQVVV